MKGRAKEWRARLLLAALSLALCLAFAEGAARILNRPAPIGPVSGTPISELSPTLGWKARALGSQRIKRDDFDVTISINSLGLRGPEIPYEASEGRKRLVILGDSFAQGYYADEPDTLRGRLDSALKSCYVDVLNGGQPGYSTDQEWLFFNEELRKYNPREVVLLFYYNDLAFNVLAKGTANRPKPVFQETGGTGHLELVPPTELIRRERGDDGEERPTRSRIRRAAPTFHRSALWAFMGSRLHRRRPDWARALAAYSLAPEISIEPPGEYLPFGTRDAGERARVEEMWKRTVLILAGLRDDVRSNGAALSVLYVPARFEVNDEAWTFVQRRYEADRVWSRNAVRVRLTETLNELGIAMVEGNTLFEDAEQSKDPAYLPSDGHWNARGNAIAFDTLFPVMRRAFGCAS